MSCSRPGCTAARSALRIYGPPETRRIVDALLTQVYDKDWQWRSMGEPSFGGWKPIVAEDVAPGLVLDTGRWKVSRRHGRSRRRPRLPAGLPAAVDLLRLPLRGRGQGRRHQRRHDCLRRYRSPRAQRRRAGALLLHGERRDRERAFPPRGAAHAGGRRHRRQDRRTRERQDARADASSAAQRRAHARELAEEVARDFSGRIVVGEDLTEIEV